MSDTVPTGKRLERAALERVILRAAQLQAGSRDLEEGLTEDDLLRLGADVGIPAPYLRQALMEERMRAAQPAETGLAAWLAGARFVAADRTLPGTVDTVRAALEHWMDDGELLQVKRRFPDQTTWEARRGTVASLKRSFQMGGRDYILARAREVAGQVSDLEAGRVFVRLVADVGNSRRDQLGGAGVLAVTGAAAAGVLILLGFAAPLAVVALPLAGAGAIAVARAHRREAERTQIALEQVLDRLEHGEIKLPTKSGRTGPQVLEWIADEIRRSLKSQ
jgi:hypothetical protein